MERKDVQTILKRIKTNYSDFVLDDYTTSEWYKELKDYDLEDVMDKLEQHFRSEQYGSQPPKVYFLTKYLVKTKDKNKNENIKVYCPICKGIVDLKEFNEHYDRCLSVEYLNDNNIKYFQKEVDKEKYRQMGEQEFRIKYNKFCEYILENTKSEEEKENLYRYFLQKD